MDDVDVWRERVRQAQDKYMQASATAAKIQSEHSQSEIEEALRAESQARDYYMAALRILTRLLNQEPPPE